MYDIVDIVQNKRTQDDLFDQLLLNCIKHNYMEFADEGDFRAADSAMERLFGEAWEAHKEEVWLWFDIEILGVRRQ